MSGIRGPGSVKEEASLPPGCSESTHFLSPWETRCMTGPKDTLIPKSFCQIVSTATAPSSSIQESYTDIFAILRLLPGKMCFCRGARKFLLYVSVQAEDAMVVKNDRSEFSCEFSFFHKSDVSVITQ